MNRIVWLASYPKSGNTWFRVFLTNLLKGGDKAVAINDLEKTPMASERTIFDIHLGIESSDLDADEIDRLRPDLYTYLSEKAGALIYMKIHDAYTTLPGDLPLIPARATYGALYFIRNPLDVAVSFAHHSGWDYDAAIGRMAQETFSFCGKPDRLHRQFRQKLMTWSGHALSWIDTAPFPICVMRYEDMKTKPMETFGKAVRFIGLSHSKDQVEKALAHSAFEVVQHQEEEKGFKEKSPVSTRFFRKGQIGSWREELNERQADRIVSDHRDMMRRFGYLDDNGVIVY